MVDVVIETARGPVTDAPPVVVSTGDPLHPAPSEDARSIGRSEPLGAGIRRVCLDRLDAAVAGLTTDEDRDAGVHRARKSMKRIRAMLRLVRDTVGYSVYRNENVVLRDAARRIAPVRDSAVLVASLDTLVERYRDGLDPEAFSDVRDRLEDRHRRIARGIIDDRALMCDVATTLRVSRGRFADWPLDPAASTGTRPAVPDRYDAISGGVLRVYRRGRARMKDAYAERTTAAFHQWRKRVKYLRYQMEALQPLWPDVIGAYARSLDELGESLGLEHDLAVLEHTLSAEPALCSSEPQRRLLGALVLHERAVLRHGARRLGALVYAEEPEVFAGRLGAYWEAARRR